MTELGDGWARPVHWRAAFVQLLADLRSNPDILVTPFSEQLLQDGVNLYSQRPDKESSLTDCISFVAMQQQGISEALMADRHFEQAGFVALLK